MPSNPETVSRNSERLIVGKPVIRISEQPRYFAPFGTKPSRERDRSGSAR